MRERVKWADESTVADRLKTHLISFQDLLNAHYADLEGDALEQKLGTDFDRFLRDRAELVAAAMKALTSGERPKLDALWATHEQTRVVS